MLKPSLRRKPLLAHQGHEAATVERTHAHVPGTVFTSELEDLLLRVADGNHDSPARRELFQQRRWDAGRGCGHDDGIVGRVFGEAERAVAGDDGRVRVTQPL